MYLVNFFFLGVALKADNNRWAGLRTTRGTYGLGGTLTFVGLLVSTTDICTPSFIYRTIFGFSPKSGSDKA
jgi:hypothetical protein